MTEMSHLCKFTVADALLVNDGRMEAPKVSMFSPPCGEEGTGVPQVSMRAEETEITEGVGLG